MRLKFSLSFNVLLCFLAFTWSVSAQSPKDSVLNQVNTKTQLYYQSINKNPQDGLAHALSAFQFFNEIADVELQFKIAVNYTTALYVNEKYATAIETLNQVHLIKKSLTNEALYYTLRGLIESELNQIEKAETNYKKALQLFIELGDKENEFTVLNNLGLLYNNIGDYKRSLDNYLKCYEIINDLNTNIDRYKYYMNIGAVSYNLNDFDNSLSSYSKALETATQNSESLRIYKVYEKIGQTNEAIKKIDIAISYYQKALKGFNSLGIQKEASRILLHLGAIYHQLNNSEELSYFEKALSIASNNGFSIQETEALLNIGLYFLKNEQFEKSKIYLSKVILKSKNQRNIEFLKSAYYGLYELEKNHNSAVAISYLEKFIAYDKEIKEKQIVGQKEQIEMQYKLKQNEFELENQQQKVQALILFSILIALVFILVLTFYFQKRKSQRLLKIQNDKIISQNMELLSINKEIKARRKELTDMNGIKDQLLSIIAHDVKSPITDLHNLLFILRHNLEALKKEELKQNLAVIESSTSNLLNLLNNILNWTISRSSGIEIIKSSFSLTEIIKANLKLVESSVFSKGLTINFEENTEEYIMYSDLNIIDFSIRNIISNAVKFTNKKGAISITINTLGVNGLEVCISDTGIGLDKNVFNMLNENTDKVPTNLGTHQEKGYGIGLSLCKNMLGKIEGSIHYEKNIPTGSIFKIILNSTQK